MTAQLIDATTGRHLWSERYDREVQEIFALQDEITKQIVAALEVKLTAGEAARVVASGTKNVKAWELLREGETIHCRITKEDNARGAGNVQARHRAGPRVRPSLGGSWVLHTFLTAGFDGATPPRSPLNGPSSSRRRH